MGERKVQNRYVPPDFDPARMPKGKRPEKGRMAINMMLPFSVQCTTCSNFMYRGTKFNSKKEDVLGEKYLGMQIFRFIMKCSQCNALFSLKTDVKNGDYAMEFGATRNFELWRDSQAAVAAASADKAEEEAYDTMRALENRTDESRRQLEALNQLEELRALRTGHAALGLGPQALLDHHAAAGGEGGAGAGVGAGGGGAGAGAAVGTWADDDEEDAAIARAVFAARRGGIKRLREAEGAAGVGVEAGGKEGGAEVEAVVEGQGGGVVSSHLPPPATTRGEVGASASTAMPFRVRPAFILKPREGAIAVTPLVPAPPEGGAPQVVKASEGSTLRDLLGSYESSDDE